MNMIHDIGLNAPERGGSFEPGKICGVPIFKTVVSMRRSAEGRFEPLI